MPKGELLENKPSINTETSLLIGSDVCPTGVDARYFISGDVQHLLDGYMELWSKSDFRILNLECPLTHSKLKLRKNGPHVKGVPECIEFFLRAKANAICLANNHINDYGTGGVLETLQVCSNAGVPIVGAGANLSEARIPFCVKVNGLSVGIMAMAEHEFSIAGLNSPGANPIDYRNFSMVKEVGEGTDFLLVLIHGGTEMLQFPRPGLVELCRFLVDQGAGAVIVQHTHCVGCYEVYKGAPIVYGQGNFIFASGPESFVNICDPRWFLGMLLELRLDRNGSCVLEFHPFTQSNGFCGIRPLTGVEKEQFINDLEDRSMLLQNEGRLHQEWMQFCRSHHASALARSIGISGLLASIDYRIPFSGLLNAVTDTELRYNMLSCESNRELLECCLRPKQ